MTSDPFWLILNFEYVFKKTLIRDNSKIITHHINIKRKKKYNITIRSALSPKNKQRATTKNKQNKLNKKRNKDTNKQTNKQTQQQQNKNKLKTKQLSKIWHNYHINYSYLQLAYCNFKGIVPFS